MNALAIMLIGFLQITFLIAIIIFIYNLVKAKKSQEDKKLYIKKAWMSLGIWILMLLVTIVWNVCARMRFENIPKVSEKNNQVTVINSGTGSMGSFATYVCTDSEIVNEVDTPHYSHFLAEKFGYTFEPAKNGQTYIALFENDCAEIAYVDVYNIVVNEENKISVEAVQHIEGESIETIIDTLSEKYGFSREELETKYAQYFKQKI